MTKPTATVQSKKGADSILRPLLFAVILGVIGAVINLYAIPYLPKIHLVLGNAVYVIVAMRLRPVFALITALIATTPLHFLWGIGYGYLIFGLEALFIAYLRSIGWYVLFADLVYWLFIGIPLTAAIIWFGLPDPTHYITFAVVKQGFNGILYTSIGCLLVFFLGDSLRFNQRFAQPQFTRGLKSFLAYAILLITSLSLVAATQLGGKKMIDTEIDLMQKTLTDSSRSIADTINLFIKHHQNVIDLAATLLTEQAFKPETILTDIHRHASDFETMLITDEQGNIQYASPIELLSIVKQSKQLIDHNVADRDYFQQAMKQQQVYTSPVFQGRGFGNDILVAISAPWYDLSRSQSPVGIVQGTINANIAQKLSLANYGEQHVEIVITDQRDQVVFASNGVGLKTLTPFHFDIKHQQTQHPLLVIAEQSTRYYYATLTLRNQWHVYTLINEDLILSNIEQQFTTMFIILSLTLLIAALVALIFAKRLADPLAFILKQIKRYDEKITTKLAPLYMQSTYEIAEIYDTLVKDKQQVKAVQENLEQQVLSRTQALNLANEKLKELAHKDSLTRLYNRHYLDKQFSLIQKHAQRKQGTLAVLMLDIDWFKKLNDQYGHLAGDHCLQTLAQLIGQVFSRETDIIVRYGGEEFLVLIADTPLTILKDKAESLRQHVEQRQFVTDEGDMIRFTISIGIFIADADFSFQLRDWIKHADDALYQAKRQGRNKIVVSQQSTI